MPEQIRSANLLVAKALSTPESIAALKSHPEKMLKDLATETVAELPRVLPAPETKTTNAIWIIVVLAFALVMVASACALMFGVTNRLDATAKYAVNGDTILTIFTTVVAFLAGLLSPSPVRK